jgi:hypothetical protein
LTEFDKAAATLPRTTSYFPRLSRSSPDWTAPEIARWINTVLFRYPGLLYDSLHAATALGISEDSFLHNKVQNAFQSAIYSGVFDSLAQRWWRDRLFKIGFAIVRSAQMEPILAESFAGAFRKIHKTVLTPSKCVVTGKEHADAVCYILRKPVLREKSLEYFPDDRPKIMEPARVSFKAIRESPDVKEEWFGTEGRRLYQLIVKGKYD